MPRIYIRRYVQPPNGKHRYFPDTKCKVPECGDFVAVLKAGLCITHYLRMRESGRVNILEAHRKCAECNKEMYLNGSEAVTRKFCSDKCRGKEKRRRQDSKEGAREKRLHYKYKWRLKRYGLTEADYQRLYASQNGACAICLRLDEECKTGLTVDHDHANGRVRGLLCRLCNAAMGGFEDSPDRLIRAAKYLSGDT